MWLLEYSREANNYAIDSHPYSEDVLSAIETLALTDMALPPNSTELEPEVYLWRVEGHLVIYKRRLFPIRSIWIAIIKPTD